MKERGLMIVVSILLAYCAGTLSFMFLKLTVPGGSLVEPNRAWASAEMSLAGLFTLIGLAGFVVALWNSLKERREKKHDTRKTTTG